MAGIYVHIPFCKQACHYCDFHFSTDLRSTHELTRALGREIGLQDQYLSGASIDTIYFGGGTPSLLDTSDIGFLLERLNHHFSIAAGSEFTIEVNPDDLTRDKVKSLRSLGFNRLSIGIQSFDDSILKFLNRAHDGAAAWKCLEEVRSLGFDNISIDLIYAIPGLSDQLWEQTLLQSLRFSPTHVSSYALTIEERTVFGNWNKRGKLVPMEEENAARQFEVLMDALEKGGYEHYEISNFCKPGFHSRHNSSYWMNVHYLGLGPAAHSYNGSTRQFNVRNNAGYIRSINDGKVPFERETLSRENQVNEYILTRLRTQWGCDIRELKSRWNDDLYNRCGKYLSTLQDHGLISMEGEVLQLTRKGKLVADKIAGDLILPT